MTLYLQPEIFNWIKPAYHSQLYHCLNPKVAIHLAPLPNLFALLPNHVAAICQNHFEVAQACHWFVEEVDEFWQLSEDLDRIMYNSFSSLNLSLGEKGLLIQLGHLNPIWLELDNKNQTTSTIQIN